MTAGPLSPRARPGVLSAGPRTMARDPASTAVLVAVVSLTAVAAVLRFTRLGHQGFWFDEANTDGDIHYSVGQMLGLLPQNETTPPLFYCVAWVWARVFGFGEYALRALPALAGVATVPAMYAATSKLVSRRAGLIAAALTACNPFLVWYSQEFRPYEPMVLLSACGLLAFAHARHRPTDRALAAWAIVSALALANHYYALLIVIPEAIWLMAVHRDTRRWATFAAVAVVGIVGVALLPLAISQNSTGNASWIAPIPLVPRLGQIVPQFLIGFQAPDAMVLERIAELCVAIGLGLLVLRSDPVQRRSAVGIGLLAVAGFALNLLLVAGGVDDLITRNVLALWPPVAVVVAAGLGARRGSWIGLTATAAICATGMIAVVGVAVDRSFQRPDWRGVGRVLGARPAASVPVRMVLVQDYRDRLPLSLYLPGLNFVHGTSERVSELDIVSIKAPRVRLCWWGAACNLTGSRMQGSYAIAGFHEAWRRHAYQFTILRLVADRPTRVTEAEIAAALRTTKWVKDELLVQRR